MSLRTFARRFHVATGLSPLQWVLGERILLARELLEETRMPVDTIARRCGFATPAGLRRHFVRHVRLTPQEYRQTFRAPETMTTGA